MRQQPDHNRAHDVPRAPNPVRFLWAALLVFFGALAALPAAASERTLSFHNLHTGEDLTVTYKRDGEYIPEAMAQINYILRDWRRDEVIEMDPRLIDLVWEVVERSGATGAVQIVCGYRAPETNAMLRANSNGVAENSQHVNGMAIDFYLPGVSLATLRATGLQMQVGGVGYYPTSGWPFVHLDTGSVRMWPRMTTAQLQQVFPDGRSLYIPDNGRPLAGYSEAQAAYQSRGETVVALFQEPVDDTPSAGFGTRLASLFGRDSTPETASQAVAAVASVTAAPAGPVPLPLPTPRTAPAPAAEVQVAAAAGPAPLPVPRPETNGDHGEEDVVVMAFAGPSTIDRDPLAILRDTALPTAVPVQSAAASTAVAVAAVVERHWSDPLARLTAGSFYGSTLPLLTGTATTRQAAFARMQAPDSHATPEILLDPERAMAGGFEVAAVTAPRTDRFSGPLVPQMAMVDLTTQNLTVASR